MSSAERLSCRRRFKYSGGRGRTAEVKGAVRPSATIAKSYNLLGQ
jgi:hypothetical protein